MCTVCGLRKHNHSTRLRTDAYLTECVAVANLSPPAAHEVHFVLGDGGHFWVPTSHKFRVFVNLVWFHVVEDNRVDIFAASQDLGKAALNVLVELAALGCAVDE